MGAVGSLRDGRPEGHDDNGGSAARYFYCAKASKADRAGSKHPTVKPVKLMQWLCRLLTPPGGVVLDPFAGSGTTGAAAILEGFRPILIEREDEYVADIRRRLNLAKIEKIAGEFPDLEFTVTYAAG
jgi:DNA modification methylase